MAEILNLFSGWQQAIRFDTNTLIVREIETHDARPLLSFIDNNREDFERRNPTYTGQELGHGRLLHHILDWKRDRIESGNATMVCYDKDDTDQKNLIATLIVDNLNNIEQPLEAGITHDKVRQSGMASEVLEAFTLKIAFNRLQARAVRSYLEWDDRPGCQIVEKAGFSFLGNEIREIPFFTMIMHRNYAVYERTPA